MGWRETNAPAYRTALTRMLGRDPTESEYFGSIAQLEHGTPQGRRAVLESAYDRYQREGGSYYDQGRHYDPVVGVNARWGSLTPASIAQHAATYDEVKGGGQRITAPGQTHFFSPAGMQAYYDKNPAMVRSAVRMDVPGHGSVLVPDWATKAVAAGDFTNVGGEWFLAPNETYGQQAQQPKLSLLAADGSNANVTANSKAGNMPIELFKQQQPAAKGTASAAPAPITIGDVPSAYRYEMAKALMGNQLTKSPGLAESITNALRSGIGTYAGMDEANKQQNATLQAVNGLPPEMRAMAVLNPKAAQALYLQQIKEAAQTRRDDAKDASVAARDDRQHRDKMEMESRKLQEAAAARQADSKSWTKIGERGPYTYERNGATGATRTYKNGSLVTETPSNGVIPRPNKPPVPVPGKGSYQSVPTGVPGTVIASDTPPTSTDVPTMSADAPPMSTDGTMPQPKMQQAAAPAVGEQTAIEGAAVPTQAAGTVDTGRKVPAGFEANPDGTVMAPNGWDYKPAFSDGTPAPNYFFTDRYLHTRDGKLAPAAYTHDMNRDEQITKRLQDTYEARDKVRPLIEQADAAIASAVKTGYRGDVIQTMRNFYSTLTGDTSNGVVPAQMINAVSMRMLPGLKAGWAGAMSNLELGSFLEAGLRLSNPMQANFVISHFMKKGLEQTDTMQRLESEWREKRAELGLPTNLTDGFDKFAQDHFKTNPVVTERDKKLMELAGKGMSVDDMRKFVSGDDSVAAAYEKSASAKPAGRGVRRQSTDGTMPKPEAAAVAAPAGDTMEIDGAKYRVKRDASGNIVDYSPVQ